MGSHDGYRQTHDLLVFTLSGKNMQTNMQYQSNKQKQSNKNIRKNLEYVYIATKQFWNLLEIPQETGLGYWIQQRCLYFSPISDLIFMPTFFIQKVL